MQTYIFIFFINSTLIYKNSYLSVFNKRTTILNDIFEIVKLQKPCVIKWGICYINFNPNFSFIILILIINK